MARRRGGKGTAVVGGEAVGDPQVPGTQRWETRQKESNSTRGNRGRARRRSSGTANRLNSASVRISLGWSRLRPVGGFPEGDAGRRRGYYKAMLRKMQSGLVEALFRKGIDSRSGVSRSVGMICTSRMGDDGGGSCLPLGSFFALWGKGR